MDKPHTPHTTPHTLRVARFMRSLTQQQLADAAGIHFNTLQRLEKGLTSPTLDTARRLAQALDTSVDALWPASAVATADTQAAEQAGAQ